MATNKTKAPIIILILILAVILVAAVIYFLSEKEPEAPPEAEMLTALAPETPEIVEPAEDSNILWKNFLSAACEEFAQISIENYSDQVIEFAVAIYKDYPLNKTFLGNKLSEHYGNYGSKARSIKSRALSVCLENMDAASLKKLILEDDESNLNEIYQKRREDDMPEDFQVFIKELALKIADDIGSINYKTVAIRSKYDIYYFSNSRIENNYTKTQKFYYRLGADLGGTIRQKAFDLLRLLDIPPAEASS